MAKIILSLDSLIEVSGSPTISNLGNPDVTHVWTSTRVPKSPFSAIVYIFDIFTFLVDRYAI